MIKQEPKILLIYKQLLADNISQNVRMLSITNLWTLGSPCKMPGCVPVGKILLNSSSFGPVSFLGQFTLTIGFILYNCFSKPLTQCNVKVIFQSKNRLSNLFWFKDSIPKELRSHLVYVFLCSNCNITYHSKSKCHLNIRSWKHLSLPVLTGKCVNNSKKLAVKITACFLITWVHSKIYQFWQMSQIHLIHF